MEAALLREPVPQGFIISSVAVGAELQPADVEGCGALLVITRWGDVSAAEMKTIVDYVKSGGGLLLSGLGWSFVGNTNNRIDRFPMNQIGRRFGVRFEHGILNNPAACLDGKSWHPMIDTFWPREPGEVAPALGPSPSVTLFEPGDGARNVPVDFAIRVKVRDDKPLTAAMMTLTAREGETTPVALVPVSAKCNRARTQWDLRYVLARAPFPHAAKTLPWNGVVQMTFRAVDGDGNAVTRTSQFFTERLLENESAVAPGPHPAHGSGVFKGKAARGAALAMANLLCYWDDRAYRDAGPYENLVLGGDGTGGGPGNVAALGADVVKAMNRTSGRTRETDAITQCVFDVWTQPNRYPPDRGHNPPFCGHACSDPAGLWHTIRREIRAGRPAIYYRQTDQQTGNGQAAIVYGFRTGTATRWLLVADDQAATQPHWIAWSGSADRLPFDSVCFAIPGLFRNARAAVPRLAGGSLNVGAGGDYRKHSLHIPAQALAADKTVFIRVPPEDARSPTTAVADFGPTTTLLRQPATLTLEFQKHDVAPGHKPEAMRLYRWNGSLWEIVADATVDPQQMTVSARVRQLGRYCAAVPVDLDGDRLEDINEYVLGTSVVDPDTDWDGVGDYAEIAYDGNGKTFNRFHATRNPGGGDLDPINPDTDGDGMLDGDELDGGSALIPIPW
jgi:hypothetical protein